MEIKAFIYHKRAEKYSDCQDCFGINSQNNRIAVSDGMSQSIFPQWWAKILVDDYLENGHIPNDIIPLQGKWQRMLLAEIQRREEEAVTNPKRDPWRLKNLLAEKSGAGATICGLTLGDKEWSCECLGDSCVIVLNHDNTLNFYTSQVGEFGNHPDYYDSFRTGRGNPIRKTINRDVKVILMVTDPFAELFQLHENNIEFIKARFEELHVLTTHESFKELVERWRDEFGMHNDDSTLVYIDDVSNSDFTICHNDNLEELCVIETDNEDIQTIQGSSESVATIENVNVSNTGNLSEHELHHESFDGAVDRFKNAVESLLAFYTGKMKERKVKDWISQFTKCPIKEFLEK